MKSPSPVGENSAPRGVGSGAGGKPPTPQFHIVPVVGQHPAPDEEQETRSMHSTQQGWSVRSLRYGAGEPPGVVQFLIRWAQPGFAPTKLMLKIISEIIGRILAKPHIIKGIYYRLRSILDFLILTRRCVYVVDNK